MAIVYQATNLVNGKRYIGRTGQVMNQRIALHLYKAKNGAKSHFSYAINKYGIDMFRFSILRSCEQRDEVIVETALIESLLPEYNGKVGGSGKRSMEPREALSLTLPENWCLEDEEWRDIPGFVGYYQVSDIGRVRGLHRKTGKRRYGYSRARARIMSLRPKKRSPHLLVHLTRSGKGGMLPVHQLVASAFIGPRPEGMNVLHKDDDAQNNVPANLYYGTQQQNIADREARGRTARGESLSPLTEDQVREIKRAKGKETQRALGERFGVTHQSIWQIHAGKTWKHVEVSNGPAV